MKRAIIAVCAAAVVLFLQGPVMAGDRVTAPDVEVGNQMTATEFEKDMTAEEWATFKREYLSRKPIPQMRLTFPGCYVCNEAPVCRSGFRMVGFVEMINYVTHIAWGEDNPSAGGYIRNMSKTINQNGMCVHDHVKGAVCNKLSVAIPSSAERYCYRVQQINSVSYTSPSQRSPDGGSCPSGWSSGSYEGTVTCLRCTKGELQTYEGRTRCLYCPWSGWVVDQIRVNSGDEPRWQCVTCNPGYTYGQGQCCR